MIPTHILLIEDDPAVAGSLRDALRQEGYDVTWKNTGAAGVAVGVGAGAAKVHHDVRTSHVPEHRAFAKMGTGSATVHWSIDTDEPVVALDERLRRQIIEDLDRMLEAFGIPAVFVSHDVAEVKWFSDHVAILDEGRLVTCGPTREVLDLAGRRGAVSPVNVVRVDGVTEADGQWSGQLGDQRLCFSPPAAPPKGGAVYLRFEARDLVIAREEIHGLSTRNRLTGRVAELVPLPGGAEVLVGIDCGERLWAELTPAAVRELSLAPGAAVFVHLKSTALKPLG